MSCDNNDDDWKNNVVWKILISAKENVQKMVNN